MTFRRPQRAGFGFTLIELLVSVALMSMILGAAYLCLNAGLRARKTVEARSGIAQRARVALNTITADLRSACPLSAEDEFIGMNRTIEEAEADNLDFATHYYTPRRQREGDFCEMSYFLDKEQSEDGAKFILWRRRDTTPDQEPLAGGSREEIVRGVQSLRLEYYDGLTWFDEWGDPERRYRAQKDSFDRPSNVSGMPEAVRITLVMAAASRPSLKPGKKPVEDEPPLTFQTVARLNLTPVSALTGSSGTDSGTPDAGVTAPGGSNPQGGQ